MSSLYSFYDWVDRIRRYYSFKRSDLIWILASVLIMAFIVGFRFGGDEFVVSDFLNNFILSVIAIVIAVFVHESAHKVVGLNMGYKIDYKPFLYGLVAGVIVAFMTYGKVILLAYSGVFLNIMEKHRLGYFRHQLGYFDLGKVSLAGPLANLFLAIIAKSLVFLPAAFVDKLVLVNVLFAITNVLPIPPLDGANIMYSSKTGYPIVLVSFVAAGVLLLMTDLNVWVTVGASLVIGIIGAALFFNFVEPRLGKA
jgi:Zn-dependent protease